MQSKNKSEITSHTSEVVLPNLDFLDMISMIDSGVMNILGKKLEAIATKYKHDSTATALIKSSMYANDLAEIVAELNDMISGMMLLTIFSVLRVSV